MSGIGDGAAIEARVLQGLKGFQRKTVDFVFNRMYVDPEPARRFLVADEVGLGKTLVARGLIARVINHLQQAGAERVDVLYICSNASIAAQNVRRLNVSAERQFALSTRITLLPQSLTTLRQNGLNFISFTPGTSFNMVSRSGLSTERAVLFRLLEYALERDLTVWPGAYRALRSAQQDRRFRNEVRWTRPVQRDDEDSGLDRTLADSFKANLKANEHLIERFERLSATDTESNDWEQRQRLILRLRQILARSCVDALQPDLVILDEFQRFRDLLQEPDTDDPNDIRQLSHQLFSRTDTRLLMLSATPYKMYTLHDEIDDNHYEDFLRVSRFLMGQEEATQLREDLDRFRDRLRRITRADDPELIDRKNRIEQRLRRFIARTERLAITSDRSGMLVEKSIEGMRLTAEDVDDFRAIDRLSRELGAGDSMEYWKSAPYLVNFMDNYKLKRELKSAAHDPERSSVIAELISDPNRLPGQDMQKYGRIDPGNARIRGLLADTVDSGAWKLLWIPPSLPYYRGTGAWANPALEKMTKRLIFSSWNVVPDAISMLVSYEAERNMMLSNNAGAENTTEYRARNAGLLTIRSADHHPASMSTFALLYPSPVLSELTDPLAIASELGANQPEITATEIHEEATRRIRGALAPLTEHAGTDGNEDQRWYWAAPILLDRTGWATEATRWWMMNSSVLRDPARGDTDSDGDHGAWADHVELARQLVNGEIELGRPPADLAETMALIGLGSPANCALRALARVFHANGERHELLVNTAVRDAAMRIAWGFRTLFNMPGVTALLRGSDSLEERAYWRRVVATGLAGNLQAVLDEYIHVLPEWQGLIAPDIARAAFETSNVVHEAVTIRAANYQADDVQISGSQFKLVPMNMRVRYALRFGANVNDDEKRLQHVGAVRSAFNSPFWPFVLATTSVGQEGLDFHQYCHAVVHWNLPANPVDLEQREGRVHRYKGHAIRKNVAARHRMAAIRTISGDPWAAMFSEAADGADQTELQDISPYWVYEGPHSIERYVPHLPLSRETPLLRRLQASLAAYRMVIGQPRQEDLLSYLQGRFSDDELDRLIQALRIDLTPQ